MSEYNARPGQEENDIEPYFDLEQASLPDAESSNSENMISNSDIPGFTPITGRKEDPRDITRRTEADEEENASGGKGPFVFPHSPAVFMGVADQAAEQPDEKPEAAPPPLPPVRTRGPPNLAYGFQYHQAGAIPQRQFPYAWENPNWAYSPPMAEARIPRPPIYPQGQPNWAYSAPIPSVYAHGQPNYGPHVQRFEAAPSGLPMYTQQPSLAYGPEVRLANAGPQGPFTYAPRYPDLACRIRNQTYR